jgi:alkylhydroperoxidase family enzyme
VPDRLRALRPEDLTADQRQVHDAITTGRRASGPKLFDLTGPEGELIGPFAAMVAHPAVGGPLQRLGEALRYESTLSPRMRELVILTVAAHVGSDFEWYAHAAVARHLDLPEQVLQALRTGAEVPGLDDADRCALELVSTLLRHDRVDHDLFARTRSALGTQGVVDVVALVGYYSLLAQLLHVFELDTPPGGDDGPPAA